MWRGFNIMNWHFDINHPKAKTLDFLLGEIVKLECLFKSAPKEWIVQDPSFLRSDRKKLDKLESMFKKINK